jgi:soluble lytic murein transglycosylase-like protein
MQSTLTIRCMSAAAMLFGIAGLAQADCWQEAGREFAIAPELLYAIAEQESNLDPRVIGHNRNGSRDIGLMQVNSSHLPRLAKRNITEAMLLNDSCQSLKVGASILADFMRRYGYSWEAVGAYNAGSATDNGAPQRRMAYAKKVAVRYQRILSARENGAGLKPLRSMADPTIVPVVMPSKPAAWDGTSNRS